MTNLGRFLKVIDSSCTAEYPVREHAVRGRLGEIIPVVFKYGEDKILPYEQALQFSKHQGFKIEEPNGDALTLPAVTPERVKASLAADEVVAKLGELTLASLILRAGQKPGGEIYLSATDENRLDLISFISGLPPVAAGSDEKAESAGGDEESLVDDEDTENGGAGDELVALEGVNPPVPVKKPADSRGVVLATSGAIELAEKYDSEFDGIVGTFGEAGLITEADVATYVEKNKVQLKG